MNYVNMESPEILRKRKQLAKIFYRLIGNRYEDYKPRRELHRFV